MAVVKDDDYYVNAMKSLLKKVSDLNKEAQINMGINYKIRINDPSVDERNMTEKIIDLKKVNSIELEDVNVDRNLFKRVKK